VNVGVNVGVNGGGERRWWTAPVFTPGVQDRFSDRFSLRFSLRCSSRGSPAEFTTGVPDRGSRPGFAGLVHDWALPLSVKGFSKRRTVALAPFRPNPFYW